MKKVILLGLFVLVLLSCDSEKAPDCLKTAGKTITEERLTESFSSILVNEGLRLVVRQQERYKVTVETGENLIADVDAKVVAGQLILSMNNTCNWVRDYGETIIYVDAPELTEIRSSTQFDVRSEGILRFESLTLLSENFQMPDYRTDGEFYLDVDVDRLSVTFNSLANAYISGQCEQLNLNFASGNSRFEGRDLEAASVNIYHRGSNDIIVNPINSLIGDLFGTGNVIVVSRPEVVEVQEHYRGRLIYE
ncbi:head GIN domain-containing protein [Robertkochia solimangrovi]|uniref:head GIN domain-containing protein n=1 Tax=Robertkochia solimangrovi TaxID=2213046 RepID=UPI00117F29BF|nr:head GIN domain-containing protein [Robertkochia solimangrovi]TRZ44388.1 DUF2807 domain-containing protein [Robertkochia solimangrovi]